MGAAPVTLAGFVTWAEDAIPGDGVAAANAGVEAGGPELGARLGTVPVTLAGFMTRGDDVLPDDDVAAPNAGAETGALEKTGVRFGAVPVTPAGFITMVSRLDDSVRTGDADGGI